MLADGLESLEGQLKYGLNPDFNPRTIVGDNYTDWHEHHYGNLDVMGQDAKHGTHVAGIIGAVRGNGIGIDGIAPDVTFMMIRTVPDGDERDKDVANAIRYAVDNGAQIISMSFGKAFSPYKAAVDDAVKYADAHGVLMVHAAGNDGEDLSQGRRTSRPRRTSTADIRCTGSRSGASSWKGGDELAADFSNYGQHAGRSVRARRRHPVDGPGQSSTSATAARAWPRRSSPARRADHELLPEPHRDRREEDSAGVSARFPSQIVGRPGQESRDKVPFGTLSITGGIVNAYNALKMADDVANGKAKP